MAAANHLDEVMQTLYKHATEMDRVPSQWRTFLEECNGWDQEDPNTFAQLLDTAFKLATFALGRVVTIKRDCATQPHVLNHELVLIDALISHAHTDGVLEEYVRDAWEAEVGQNFADTFMEAYITANDHSCEVILASLEGYENWLSEMQDRYMQEWQ